MTHPGPRGDQFRGRGKPRGAGAVAAPLDIAGSQARMLHVLGLFSEKSLWSTAELVTLW